MDSVGTSTASDGSAPVIPLAANFLKITAWLSLCVIAIGLIVLLGWATNIELFKSVLPGLTTMKANTAVSLILLSFALFAVDRPGRINVILVFACILCCLSIALVTAAEYVSGANLHIDNFLFRDPAAIIFPGRMAPTTILCFVAYSIALLLLQIKRGVFIAQAGMSAIIVISITTLGGYLYGAPQMLAHAPYPVVALNTALCMILLAIGGLLKRPTEGPMRVMLADTTGGWIARRLIPTALAVPLTVGLCVVTGERAGLYGAAFSVALVVSADVALMTAVVWSVASLLSRSDAIRQISERTAEQHSRLKDNFLATLSHELRTPLMAILGWAVLLAKRRDLDDEAREGVTVIERNARAQTQIIEDLLDMSRIISGKMRLEMQRVDLRQVIAGAIQTARPSAQAKSIELHVSIDPQTPPVMADPNRMQQIAWNLLSNAIKFTPRGGWVRVHLQQHESQVRLLVEDNGQGIKNEFLPYLFERFHQADAGTNRRFGGLGLGLSIVRQLVEMHGGVVSAQSRGEGLGSTFCVSFPIAAIQAVSPAQQNVFSPRPMVGAASSSSASSPTVRGLRVLVVDDEADARFLIRRVLEDCHAIVVTAESAGDALAKLDRESFDILISDIGMPDRDGYELIRDIRQRDASAGGTLPAAALTAFARVEDRERALAAGFQVHTAKPIEPSELIATIASLVKVHEDR